MTVGLIGHGYWGRNLLRNLADSAMVRSVLVADAVPARVDEAVLRYTKVSACESWEQMLADPQCEAVIIATPTSQHYHLASQALKAGKHVLVEKPMVTSEREALGLISLADNAGLVLMVDHIFVYNPVVARIREELASGAVGPLSYIDSTRVNLGIYQTDVNVLWDLACHDLSIVYHLLEERPTHVRAVGRVNERWGSEDVAYLFLHYASGLMVHVSASWASPVKMRRMVLGGERRMLIYDDIEPTNKLVIHDYQPIHGSTERSQVLTDYRLGTVTIPKFEAKEPLREVVDDFLTCIQTGGEPKASAEAALPIVRTLECAELSLRNGGELIAL